MIHSVQHQEHYVSSALQEENRSSLAGGWPPEQPPQAKLLLGTTTGTYKSQLFRNNKKKTFCFLEPQVQGGLASRAG